MSDTFDRLKKLLVAQLGCDPETVTPSVRFVPEHDLVGRLLGGNDPNLGCDSLDVVEMVMSVEEEFDIEIRDDESEPLNDGNVQDLVDLIDEKRRAAA